ncbi:hypothetical protein [Streptomyces sp. AM6-12]|uniref:hypothetical protein n=1 Tax=Streptomyces sp. AM6-12 TaxID=3345149 RepID=UPI0037BCD93A
MTTEARHSSVPPSPSHSSGPGAGRAEGTRAAAARADMPAGEDPGDEPSVFTRRAPGGGTGPASGTPRRVPVPEATGPVSPPPPPASARFPDAPPRTARTGTGTPRLAHTEETTGGGAGSADGGSAGTRGSGTGSGGAAGADGSAPSDRRPGHPVPGASARPPASAPSQATRPATRWQHQPPAPPAFGPVHSRPGAARPRVTFGEPDLFRTRRRGRAVAAGVCLVLGIGLIGGAVAGSWLTGEHEDSAARGFAAAAPAWHSVPVDSLFPPVVKGAGEGPGGADRTWTRVAVAPDSGCADAFDPLLWQVLAGTGCRRLLRATYTDATQSYVTTVGLLFTKADPAQMAALATRFRTQHLAGRTDLMPRPYAAGDTPAAGFGDDQRATWTISVRTDAPVVVYAVSGWADGRGVDTPQPAADAVQAGATTAQAQSGLGNEALGLSGQITRRLRQAVGSAATNAPDTPDTPNAPNATKSPS